MNDALLIKVLFSCVHNCCSLFPSWVESSLETSGTQWKYPFFIFIATLDSSIVVEWLSEDTFICHNIVKRVWPASQRDALFWTHIRHVQGDTDEEPDLWIVCNYSTDHETIPVCRSMPDLLYSYSIGYKRCLFVTVQSRLIYDIFWL